MRSIYNRTIFVRSIIRVVYIISARLHPLYIGGPMTHSATKAVLMTALTAGFLFASTQVHFGQQPAQQPAAGAAAPGAQRGGGRGADPRIQQRTYIFKDTNEE